MGLDLVGGRARHRRYNIIISASNEHDGRRDEQITVRVPPLGEGAQQAVVSRWIVREGSVVAKDQPLVELETDKAIIELPCPATGCLVTTLVPEGATVSVGDPLALVDLSAMAQAKT